MKRICIFPKDIQLITGRSERWGRLLIAKIKKEGGKQKHHLVTIEEFCSYTGIEKELVLQTIK